MENDKFLKLTNTVYKVLDFFPESDPLKNRAKDKALAIMENLILVEEIQRLPAGRQGWATLADAFSESKTKAQLLEDIDILLGYLWIGKSQGWMNSINYLIIANEFEKIKKNIKPIIEPIQKPVEISEPTVIPIIIKENTQNPPLFKITVRQGKIIEFLSKNKKAQVMDLQTVLPDITKRTIRRDLDELLEAGKIARFGEFNQVFYKLADTGDMLEIHEN
jgi:DNA-binding transcriptional ArsR family regulator